MTTQRALICSHYMPQPDLDSYSRRLFHFIRFLREAGWEVSCVARSPKGVEEFRHLLTEQNVPVAFGFAKHEENVRQAATSAWNEIAILGFWNFAEPLIRILQEVSPATRRIVDSGDLHFLRTSRRILRNAPACLDLLDATFASETAREIGVYAAADSVLAVSHKEADLIGDLIGAPDRVFVVPDCEDLAASVVPFAERRGMFFVGNFEHSPNAEALRFLCNEIVPHIDRDLLAAHPISVAGSNMTEEIRRVAEGTPGLQMLGWVPSVATYFEQARVSLLPVLHGAGTKRKLIQALSVGTPTVSTHIGIEGFAVRDEEAVMVADDPFPFANAIARLLTDEELWSRIAARGRELIRQEHSANVARERLLTAIASTRRRQRDVGNAPNSSAPISPTDPRIPFSGRPTACSVRRTGSLKPQQISVVIPTRNRAHMLGEALASLAAQSASGRFDVIVVSDGSTDETSEVCDQWAGRMPLMLIEAPPAGISVAKNIGVNAATAPLLLFFDDDDVADPDLIAQHLEMHRRYPLEHVAVLGYTDWSPQLEVTDVMRFVTEVGCYLFGYPNMRHGKAFDYRFFWGGRSSCKRSLLVRAGGFRPEFTFGSEDIEAAFRISRMLGRERAPALSGGGAVQEGSERVGMVVVYNKLARQHAIRPITYDEFCERCRRQGRSQWQFTSFYDDPRVTEWCGTSDIRRRWEEVRDLLPSKVQRVHAIEAELRTTAGNREALIGELHQLYYHTFDAFKLQGIVEAAGIQETAT